MLQRTEHLYIVTDDQILGGEPIIDGTRTPVRAIVELWRQGIAPETIPAHLPHLTLAQVFDALSYYSDHQDECHALAVAWLAALSPFDRLRNSGLLGTKFQWLSYMLKWPVAST
jgi:uncharacterized protein (DUF433 family)